MAFGTGFGALASGSPTALGATQPADPKLEQPPSDTVSSISWSPTANVVAATSWDKSVRCWEITATGAVPRALRNDATKPLLCSAWNGAGTHLFYAGCEGKAMQWDLGSNQATQVAQHDAPISEMAFIPSLNCLATGSWDKTLRFWDLRQSNPIHKVDLGERCLAMAHRDASAQGGGNILVVGTADLPPNTPVPGLVTVDPNAQHQQQRAETVKSGQPVRPIFVFDMRNPTGAPVIHNSPLSYQSRVLEVFHDGKGYLVGSIEGRVGVQWFPELYDASNNRKSFTFRCHRLDMMNKTKNEKLEETYPLNAITVHPQSGTFATAGADGRVCYWDKDNRTTLGPKVPKPEYGKPLNPVTACKFNRDGTLLAYAKGYDWFAGPPANPANYPVEMYIHQAQPAEITPNKKK